MWSTAGMLLLHEFGSGGLGGYYYLCATVHIIWPSKGHWWCLFYGSPTVLGLCIIARSCLCCYSAEQFSLRKGRRYSIETITYICESITFWNETERKYRNEPKYTHTCRVIWGGGKRREQMLSMTAPTVNGFFFSQVKEVLHSRCRYFLIYIQ